LSTAHPAKAGKILACVASFSGEQAPFILLVEIGQAQCHASEQLCQWIVAYVRQIKVGGNRNAGSYIIAVSGKWLATIVSDDFSKQRK